MFSKHKNPNLPVVAGVPSIISAGLKVKGDLISDGSIEIEGEVEGNISCAQVTVRHDGRVNGDVVAEVVQIDGTIDGLVRGKFVYVSETGRVSGMLVYESLSIKDGAQIDGQCKSQEKLHRGEVEAFAAEDTKNAKAKKDKDKSKQLGDKVTAIRADAIKEAMAASSA